MHELLLNKDFMPGNTTIKMCDVCSLKSYCWNLSIPDICDTLIMQDEHKNDYRMFREIGKLQGYFLE